MTLIRKPPARIQTRVSFMRACRQRFRIIVHDSGVRGNDLPFGQSV
jgi:hypothetical protein